jgi:hypothetical protein
MFMPPEIFRPVLDLLTKRFLIGSIVRMEPRDDCGPVAAASQCADLRKTVALPDLEGCAEPVPAESGANAPMQLAVLHK